jgi:hypothetical protein
MASTRSHHFPLTLFATALVLFTHPSHAQGMEYTDPTMDQGRRLFEQLNHACGFEAGQTPNRSPDCLAAQRRMEEFQQQNRAAIKQSQANKDKAHYQQYKAMAAEHCAQSPDGHKCEHYGEILRNYQRRYPGIDR